jgi:YD repeat-containing protein
LLFEGEGLGVLVLLPSPPKRGTTFVYDNLNRVVEEEGPLGNSVTYTYNDAGLVTSRTGSFLENLTVGVVSV